MGERGEREATNASEHKLGGGSNGEGEVLHNAEKLSGREEDEEEDRTKDIGRGEWKEREMSTCYP